VILWESRGIMLAAVTILVSSMKNPSIKFLQFGSIHAVPIPHFTYQLIGAVLPASQKKTEMIMK
jgi:hypothetical protein